MELLSIILIIILSIIILFSIFMVIFCYFFIYRDDSPYDPSKDPMCVGTHWELVHKEINEKLEWLKKQELLQVSVKSRDGLTLRGFFLKSKKETNNVVICVHGYRSDIFRDYPPHSEWYLNEGYNLLLINNRAHHLSDGNWIGFGILDRYDVLEWIKFLEDKYNKNCNIFLHGISMGGATVMQASNIIKSECVKGIVEDCGFTSLYEELICFLKPMKYIPKSILNFYIKLIVGYKLDEVDSRQCVSETKIPILFIHGDKDFFVPSFMSKQCYEKCSSKKELLIIDDAYHAEAYYIGKEQMQKAILKFFKECLEN